MSKGRGPDPEVEAEPLEANDVVAVDDDDPAVPETEPDVKPERRRRKRRLIWPLALVTVLAAASGTIAQAAALPPLPAVDFDAAGLVTDAPQEPIEAVVPTAGPLASAAPAPFGPQLEVILPPPPPPPPAPGKRATTAQRKAAAEEAVSAGVTTDQYCDAKYGATSSASSPSGLLEAANAERAIFGLAPLAWSSSLESLAQQWSDALASSYDPADPGGNFYHDMIPSPGGQNLALYGSSPAASQGTAIANAHTGWMKSPGHCKNILRAGFTTMGAATTQTSDGIVWYTTVDFQ